MTGGIMNREEMLEALKSMSVTVEDLVEYFKRESDSAIGVIRNGDGEIVALAPSEGDTIYDPNYIKVENLKTWLETTYIRKNRAYGNSFTDTMDIFGMNACYIRLYDKLKRLRSLYSSRSDEMISAKNEESIFDTLADTMNYLIMSIAHINNTSYSVTSKDLFNTYPHITLDISLYNSGILNMVDSCLATLTKLANGTTTPNNGLEIIFCLMLDIYLHDDDEGAMEVFHYGN